MGSGRITQKVWTKIGQNAIWGSGVELKSTNLEICNILTIEDRMQCSVCNDYVNLEYLFCECG